LIKSSTILNLTVLSAVMC